MALLRCLVLYRMSSGEILRPMLRCRTGEARRWSLLEYQDQAMTRSAAARWSTSIRTLLDGVAAKRCSVSSNMMRVMANSPAVFDGYLSFGTALGKGVLPAALRERIAIAVAEANACCVCLAAYTQFWSKRRPFRYRVVGCARCWISRSGRRDGFALCPGCDAYDRARLWCGSCSTRWRRRDLVTRRSWKYLPLFSSMSLSTRWITSQRRFQTIPLYIRANWPARTHETRARSA